MSVRINLEIGHEAAIRTKRTQEGFTHDWEVFVRGCEHANIQYFVEKVVFYLHETFPKPKRVIKDPPYSVKESGYAGFTLPIEIHLRNKDEPKKIMFNYDLNLQQTGPAIIKVQKEKYVFHTPGEEFKSKLLKGGGLVVPSSGSQELSRESRPASEEKSQLVSKPRLGGSDFAKKHKPKLEEPRISNSFQDLFGPPITKSSKTSLESKPISKDKNSNINKSGSGDKEKSKTKHSPHKDKEKDKDKEKFREKGDSEKKIKDDKKREEKKEHSKDREERIKEKKERREKSPKIRSPTPTKRPTSPKRPPSPLPKYKDKEEKKIELPKEKKTPEDKEKDKSEKKAKKEKRDKDKERKESKHKDKDSQKSAEQKENKNASRDKEKHKEPIISVKDKEPSPLPPKIEKKEKPVKEKESIKDYVKEIKEIDHIDKNGKFKNDKLEEKPKHKHKKKDKEKKEKDKMNEKEKAHKSEKKVDKSVVSTASKYVENNKDAPKEIEKSNLFNSPKNNLVEPKINEKPKKPLNALLEQFVDNDTSNSSISSQEDFNDPPVKVEPKKEPIFEPQPPPKPEPPPEKPKVKKEKTKKNKDKKADKDNEKKRKRKSETNRVEEPSEKIPKEDTSNSNSKDSDTEQTSTQIDMQTEIEENYEDYMNILRDLQRKILTLQDNSELQKVVQLIAETGRFEVSAQTFDFDLCLLERSTIKQLQNFFESTS